MEKKIFFSLLKKTVLIAVFLFVAHYFTIHKLLINYHFYYPVYSIYMFLFTITLIILLLLMVVYQNYKEKTGFAFMVFSVLKMAFSVVFLIPLINSDLNNKIPDVLSFFIPFFIFLIFETKVVLTMINKK